MSTAWPWRAQESSAAGDGERSRSSASISAQAPAGPVLGRPVELGLAAAALTPSSGSRLRAVRAERRLDPLRGKRPIDRGLEEPP